jgi:hypothetical protein
VIDKNVRSDLEDTIIDNFGTVDVTFPPDHAVPITFSTVIKHMTQEIIDEILDRDENFIVIAVEYPTMDNAWVRVMSDYWGQGKADNLDATVPPAALDFIRVNDAVTAEFTFTTSEPNLSKIGIYTKNPIGSTSWLQFELRDEFGGLLFNRLIFNTELTDDGWSDIDVGLTIRIDPSSGTSRPMTVTLTEETFGSNPIGIDIGKDGVDIAYRLYSWRISPIFGKISRGIMRLSVFAKDKKKAREPEPTYFVSKDDIVAQVAGQLRNYIWANWTSLGLNDVTSTVISSGETSKTTVFASAIFDVSLVVQDFGTVATPSLTLKQITIENKGV